MIRRPDVVFFGPVIVGPHLGFQVAVQTPGWTLEYVLTSVQKVREDTLGDRTYS